MSDFSVEVEQWINQALSKSEAIFRGIGAASLARVKELTPVKTGYLRANFSLVISLDLMPTTGAAVDMSSQAKLGDTLYIVNPVTYARRVEYGFHGKDSLGRTYHQIGRGMVTQTIAEMPQIAARVLSEMLGAG